MKKTNNQNTPIEARREEKIKEIYPDSKSKKKTFSKAKINPIHQIPYNLTLRYTTTPQERETIKELLKNVQEEKINSKRIKE